MRQATDLASKLYRLGVYVRLKASNKCQSEADTFLIEQTLTFETESRWPGVGVTIGPTDAANKGRSSEARARSIFIISRNLRDIRMLSSNII